MTRLFRVSDKGLVESQRKSLDLERRIQDWVEGDLTLIGAEGIILGREVRTAHGKRIDLLAMDEEGNLIIIELKRDSGARDIVAQVLDYASWVCRLTTNDVHEIAKEYRQRSLAEIYREKFGKSPPETLNATHQMIVVASEVDEPTKRIIEYLSEQHDVGINASFFNIFGAEGHEWLTTDSLLDQEEVKDRSIKKARAPWSGLYYTTGGSEENRPWEDLRQNGFITASGGRIYSNKLDNLEVGAPIFFYQKGTGYLGFGHVASPKVRASDFILADGTPLTEKLPNRPYLTEFGDDPDRASYVVGVDWKRTFDRQHAKTFTGIFANQNIVCKIYDQETADFLRKAFDVAAGDEQP
jgi:hypothetical protein